MTYSALEACRLAGCTYRQLDHWCRCAVFGPEHVEGGGPGSRRHFTAGEIEAIAVVTRLARSAAGLTTDALAAAVRKLEEHSGMVGWIVLDYHAKTVQIIEDLETLAVFASAVIVRLDLCRFQALKLEASVV